MIDLYIYCNTVRLFSLCLPLLDVGIDSLQEHREIHLQNSSIRLVVFCLKECRPENSRHTLTLSHLHTLTFTLTLTLSLSHSHTHTHTLTLTLTLTLSHRRTYT